jgi:hypothetical protein
MPEEPMSEGEHSEGEHSEGEHSEGEHSEGEHSEGEHSEGEGSEGEGSDFGSDEEFEKFEEDWHTPMVMLGMCLDGHGNVDGKVNAGEIVLALDYLVELGELPAEAVDEMKEEAKAEGVTKDTEVDMEAGAELVSELLTAADVHEEEWYDLIDEAANHCFELLDEKMGTMGPMDEPMPPTEGHAAGTEGPTHGGPAPGTNGPDGTAAVHSGKK